MTNTDTLVERFAKLANHDDLRPVFVDDTFPLNIGVMNGNVVQSVIRGALTVGDIRGLAALLDTLTALKAENASIMATNDALAQENYDKGLRIEALEAERDLEAELKDLEL